MNGDQTVNLNAADCLKSNDHLGYTVITNVCKGTSQMLSWGAFDWIETLLLVAFCVGLVALVFVAAFKFLTLD